MTLGDLSGFSETGAASPFQGEPAEFGSRGRALPPPSSPGGKQRLTCQAPLGSPEGPARRCSGPFWRRSRIAQVRYGSSLDAAADLCVSPGSLPSPVSETLRQLGRGVGVWGQGKGECRGPIGQAGAGSPQNRRRRTFAFFFLIYADEPVICLISQAHSSLVPAVVG